VVCGEDQIITDIIKAGCKLTRAESVKPAFKALGSSA
jgi:hypothetical protein